MGSKLDKVFRTGLWAQVSWNAAIESDKAPVVFDSECQQVGISHLPRGVNIGYHDLRGVENSDWIWPEQVVPGLAGGLQTKRCFGQ